VVSAPVDCVPEVALLPDHAPEAEQEVALVEDQVRIEDPPLGTVAGFAVSEAVTLGAAATISGAVESSTSLPAPQAESIRASTRTSSEVLERGIWSSSLMLNVYSWIQGAGSAIGFREMISSSYHV
jgi:hypothetical protein